MNTLNPSAFAPDAVPLPEIVLEGDGVRSRRSLVAEYLSIANRRKWLIAATVAAFLVGGLLVTLFTTPLYKTSAVLEIQRENRNFADVKGTDQAQASTDNEFYQTQYGLLRSRALAERIARTLRLGDNPAFFEGYGEDAPEALFDDNGSPIQTRAARDGRVKAAGALVLAHMDVEPQRLSRLVEIGFTSPDPALAQRVVNAWSLNFVQSTLERRFAATSYARNFLEDRLAQLRARIDQSERALVGYAARANIVSIPGTTDSSGATSGERSLVVDDLANLNRALSDARAERVLAESRLGSANAVREQLDNATASTLRTRRAELAADYARLLQQFDAGYPPARALQAQIRSIDGALAGETGRVGAVLRETAEAARQREAQLQAQVNRLTGRVLDFRRRSIQYNILQREVDTNRQLYDALLQRYKEIGVAGGVGVNNIAVVDDADLPVRPARPRPLFNMALALLGGLVAGVALALLLEQVDEGLTDPIEVEEALGLPLIGVTPRLAGEKPVDVLGDPKSPLTEAYASIVANLGFATSHGIPRTLAVTSARAAEGKSSTSYAVARSIARMGRSVVLVDADMRSPSVHKLVGGPLGNGLSNFLAGSDDVDALIRPTEVDGMAAISAGPQPPSTPELLSGDRLRRLMDVLGARYDHIVFDLPPVMGLADAPLISAQVEGVLVCTAAHSTHKNMARIAIGRLRNAHAHLLGVVLSMFDVRQASYGYGYGYGYGNGYKYGDTADRA
jgi:polysaccharide biosynthesis transport protein